MGVIVRLVGRFAVTDALNERMMLNPNRNRNRTLKANPNPDPNPKPNWLCEGKKP